MIIPGNEEIIKSRIIKSLTEYVKLYNKKSFVLVVDELPSTFLLNSIFTHITSAKLHTVASKNKTEVESVHEAIGLADKHDGLVVGSVCRNEYFIRSYHKYGYGLADVFPLIDFYHSEICELFGLTTEAFFFGMPHRNVEWADRENLSTNIITGADRPNTYKEWFKYTLPQKEMISMLWQRLKRTKHKDLNLIPMVSRNNLTR